jgi:hypothetical protein
MHFDWFSFWLGWTAVSVLWTLSVYRRRTRP